MQLGLIKVWDEFLEDYVREKLGESFKLKDDKLRMVGNNVLTIQIDYDGFKKSDLFRSWKGIDKYKL